MVDQGAHAPPKTNFQIFDQCVIGFVLDSNLSQRMIDELSTILEHRGATILEPDSDGTLSIKDATHIIAHHTDFAQFTEAQAFMVPVVTSQWVSTSIHRGKQMPLRQFSPDPRMIFSKAIITCADLPTMDKETIIGAVTALGGMEIPDVTRQTTHVVALSMDHPKCVAVVKNSLKTKIVLPHWFDDCFKLGKRIDEGPYLLPDPAILKAPSSTEIAVPDQSQLEGASSTQPTFIPVTGSARTRLTVFAKKNVMMSSDLALTPRLREIISGLIREGGGSVVDDVSKCDIFVCQHRQGDDYVEASQHCKDVGNLAWLYYLIINNEWTSPLRRLLHYPTPPDGIPGFKDMKITISNYGGEARIYLENLVNATGATFTKTLRSENTHLITARDNSEKCQAARDWNITMVNHLWIEECYAQCELVPVSKRHIHFPPHTNLGEIIGQTFLDESKLEEKYYPIGDKKLPAAVRKKRKILDAARQNTYQSGPADGTHDPEEALEAAAQAAEAKSSDDEETIVAPRAKKTATTKAKSSSAAAFSTPARNTSRGVNDDDTPSVMSTGGRSAKSKALTNLQKLAPDIALYEKEKKRMGKDGSGPWGGKRAADQLDKENQSARSSSPVRGDDGDDDMDELGADDAANPAKRQRLTLPAVTMRLILTGFLRWVDDKQKESRERKKLRELGILIVQENQKCDYIAAPQIIRTVKFLVHLAQGPTFLSTDFIETVLKTGKVPPAQDYLLKDKASEKKWNFDLETSIARARANKGKLLAGMAIHCTSNISNGADTFKTIAEAHGGVFKIYRARSGTTLRPPTREEEAEADGTLEPVYLLSSGQPDERVLWTKFEDMALKAQMEGRVVCADWLLDCVLRQEVTFDEKFLAKNYFKN